MPDKDIVERSLRRVWCAPYRLIKGGHPIEIVADKVVEALAATLREDGGFPGLNRLLAVQGLMDTRSLAEVSRAIEQDFEQKATAKLIVRAAQRNMAQVDAGRSLPGPLPLVLNGLELVVRHHFFSKIQPRLVGKGKRFASVQESREFTSSIFRISEPRMRNLAQRLLADPTASQLRVPNLLVRRRTTAEILNSPISKGV